MSNNTTMKLPVWFWIVAGVALVWNLMGVAAYIAQMTMSDDAISALPAAEQSLYANYPAWAAGAFAVAVFGGAIGCVLILLRKNIAVPVLSASLVGIVVQMFHSFVIANSMAVYGPGAAIMPTMVVLIGAGLVWWSLKLKGKGWLQ